MLLTAATISRGLVGLETSPARNWMILNWTAFDTIGLCSFGYRFNEFYLEKAHPFAQQMADVLLESGRRANRPSLMNQFYRADERERQENVRKMHELSDEIIAERKRNPQPDSTDLLNTMLNTVDRETGEALSDENIRFNMCTFLVSLPCNERTQLINIIGGRA